MENGGVWNRLFFLGRKLDRFGWLISTCLRPILPYTENFLVSDCLSENDRHLNHISYFLSNDVKNKVSMLVATQMHMVLDLNDYFFVTTAYCFEFWKSQFISKLQILLS